MYVIRHGLLEVLVAAPTTVEALVGTAAFDAPPKYDRVRVMGPGGLLRRNIAHPPAAARSDAAIRAKSRCDFYRLKKADFDELLELFLGARARGSLRHGGPTDWCRTSARKVVGPSARRR